jgi:putative transposase
LNKSLKERMQIPVLHDDQHGATIIVCATTCNGLHLVNKPLEEIKLVTAGAGAATLACLNLKGFPEAIGSIYPNTEVQLCIIHQIRNSLKYVASKHQKAFMADLKGVYKAATLNAAETALDELEAKWGGKYPVVIKSWRSKWPTLSAYFKYPGYVRTAIYTTNAVEAVHRQFRKLTKTKGGFANENSLLKLLYAGILKASGRWTHPIQNWNLALSQMTIHFPGRLDGHISL